MPPESPFQFDWTQLLPVAKSYVDLVADSGIGNGVNVLIYFMSAALALRIIYVTFGGKNNTPGRPNIKGAPPK